MARSANSVKLTFVFINHEIFSVRHYFLVFSPAVSGSTATRLPLSYGTAREKAIGVGRACSCVCKLVCLVVHALKAKRL